MVAVGLLESSLALAERGAGFFPEFFDGFDGDLESGEESSV